MTTKSKLRIPAIAAAAVLTFGVAASADASVLFRNTTDQPIHFGITCSEGGYDWWTVSPHGTKNIYCKNGSDRAMVEIRTAHRHHDEVVHAIVYDGAVYRFDYDDDGDVNIFG